MLPEGILDSFEITGFKEEVTQEEDETGTVIKIQKAHAGEWMLLEGNIGERLSIDETMRWLRLLK